MKKFTFLSLIVCSLLFFNCNINSGPPPTEEPSPTSTTEPSPTPTEVPNDPPAAEITSPENNSIFMCDGYDYEDYATISFVGTATDQEDADNTLLVEWFSSTDGKLGEGRELTAHVHMTETCNQTINITLRITDSGSLVTEVSIRIYLYVVC